MHHAKLTVSVSRVLSSRLSTSDPHATSDRQSTRTSSPDSTDLLKCFWVYHTRQRSICGHWAVSLWSCSSVYLCSLDRLNTTRSLGSQRCSALRHSGCWKWASSLANSLRRLRTSTDVRTTDSSLWSSTRGSTAQKSSPARSTSRPRPCQTSSGTIQCRGRT